MPASTLPLPTAQRSTQTTPVETANIRAVRQERFETPPMADGIYILAASADTSTLSVELEANGFGTLPLGRNDWGYDAERRELFVDPGLLVRGTVVRVRYAAG